MSISAGPLAGVDAGTTSVSLVVVDSDSGRNLYADCREHNALLKPDVPGAHQQDPDLIANLVVEMLGEASSVHPDIAAIGITGQMHGVMLLSETGRALTPAYTWLDEHALLRNPDGRTYLEAMEVELGVSVPKGFGLGTLYWLSRSGGMPTEAHSAAGVPEYVAMRISGRSLPCLDPCLAHSLGCRSQRDGILDIELWDAVSKLRPPVVAPSASVIGTTGAGIPVVTPTGDNQAGFLAAVRDPERAMLFSLGTSGQVSLLRPSYRTEAPADSAMEERPFPNGDQLLVGASLSGGSSFAILANLIREVLVRAGAPGAHNPFSILDSLPRPSNAESLVVDTRFAGTRRDPDARGAIQNIGTENFTLGNLYWGVAHGVIDELLDMLGPWRRVLSAPESYVTASGNALKRSEALQEILQQKVEVPVRWVEEDEAAARGAAILAGAALLGGEQFVPSLRDRLVHYQKGG